MDVCGNKVTKKCKKVVAALAGMKKARTFAPAKEENNPPEHAVEHGKPRGKKHGLKNIF
jgi:hypothetical protein